MEIEVPVGLIFRGVKDYFLRDTIQIVATVIIMLLNVFLFLFNFTNNPFFLVYLSRAFARSLASVGKLCMGPGGLIKVLTSSLLTL